MGKTANLAKQTDQRVQKRDHLSAFVALRPDDAYMPRSSYQSALRLIG
jgi:hypothetical protein